MALGSPKTYYLHFCKTRWVEDNPVPVRGIQMWENIIQYWLSLSRGKRPHNRSFDTLVKCHADKLIISKLHFLKKYIVSILKPFLLQFQTSKPMIPFFAVDLDIILRQLTPLVAKSKVAPDANTSYLPLQLDLGKNENLSNIDKVEFGSTVTSYLAN